MIESLTIELLVSISSKFYQCVVDCLFSSEGFSKKMQWKLVGHDIVVITKYGIHSALTFPASLLVLLPSGRE